MTISVEEHPSVGSETTNKLQDVALTTNHVSSILHYLTPNQCRLWSRVSACHSPATASPDFARIYTEAFRQITSQWLQPQCSLVALGPGGGSKEKRLLEELAAAGVQTDLGVVDAGMTLATQTLELCAPLCGSSHGIACDVAETDFLINWIARHGLKQPRLWTAFGLFPNSEPPALARQLATLCSPGDTLLCSANLGGSARECGGLIESHILAQYDNPETSEWLMEWVRESGLAPVVDPPEFEVVEEGTWAEVRAISRRRDTDAKLLLFRSTRFSAAGFRALMQGAGFTLLGEWTTPCLQEGVWLLRRVA